MSISICVQFITVFLVLEKFYVMNKENCKESLEIYKKFLTRTDQFSEFLKVAQVRLSGYRL